jgi:hypothetical protein
MSLEGDRIDEIVRLMESWEWDAAMGLVLMEEWGISEEAMVSLVRQAVPRAPGYEPLRVARGRDELDSIDRFIAVLRKRASSDVFAEMIAELERQRRNITVSIGKPGPVS